MKVPPDPERCTFEFADGRRCRGWRMTQSPTCLLCYGHTNAEKRRIEAEERRKLRQLEEPPAPPFVNVTPLVAQNFLAGAKDRPFTSVAAINHLMEKLLLMVVANSMSARSATACAQLLRLLLKSLPLLEREKISVENRASGERFQKRVQQILAGEMAKAAADKAACTEEPVPAVAD